ncbi:polysaccharide deacetylase family protein [Falsiroseomonas sp. CW058]|uniref:polysaccharide deacetylase family protein n=1 Tax=Falsiroseomonas sp. CW058 TaxID=3388664 RepID=UPI003D31E6E4
MLAAVLLAPPALAAPPSVEPLVEPRMRLAQRPAGELPVALTLDACGGGFDPRIAQLLVELRIPATIFATELWLRRNAAALALLAAHPALFGIENHGAQHIPPVLGHRSVFGLQAAGDIEAVRREVRQGAAAIEAATGTAPRWYRGATACYSAAALPEIARMGFGIAGYSLNGDAGASLPAAAAAARIASARAGDVILAHVNHPDRAAGAGVAAGLRDLHRRGARFLRLDRLGPADLAYAGAVPA